jgi:hypothetical protein
MQIRGEFASESNLAFGVLAGGGILDGHTGFNWYDKGPHPMFLIGAQMHYYLFGDFSHGMQVGAQTLFTATNRDADSEIYRTGRNIHLAPYLGYKAILSPGFTVNLQAGAGTTFHRDFQTTDVNNLTNQREGYYYTHNDLYVLLHLDFGWSF